MAIDDLRLSGTAWTGPANITFQTDAVVELERAANSDYLAATNFGFAIPEGARIRGISVTWLKESRDALQAGTDRSVKLIQDGIVGGREHARSQKWAGTYTYGSAFDLWGLHWTPEQINSSRFGAAIAAQAPGSRPASLAVRSCEITVYYTPAPPGKTSGRRKP